MAAPAVPDWPNSNHSPSDTCTSPSSFTIQVEGNNPDSASFLDSDTGTRVTLGVGEYRITELDPGPRIVTTFTADCNGVIQPGDQKTCKIPEYTNKFHNNISRRGHPKCPNGFHRSPDGDCERVSS
ncbi:MAG: hypothetical protein WBX01_08735 [Nitrososphaeraceae archaeon]